MPDSATSPLDQADALISAAWGRPIEELEALAPRRPVDDPLLRSAMRIRSSLVVLSTNIAVHQDRLHALTRPGHTPAFYDLERITDSASGLRVAHAESRTALQAIGYVIDARDAATAAGQPPAVRLAQAAVARSAHAPRPLGQPPGELAPLASSGPAAAVSGPRR
ncbi:hypothetical protein ACIGXM_25225 [Kitasatospora sp. NPDC052896]|uniref:hypothetical protein n=1 Tax=Kitasatospora sp. NPDC052896 TaxID=3364061 RepID=UPI0037C9531F